MRPLNKADTDTETVLILRIDGTQVTGTFQAFPIDAYGSPSCTRLKDVKVTGTRTPKP
jgi:hypothetical protein